MCHRKTPLDDPRIYIPDAMLPQLVASYHTVLNHPGMNILESTLSVHFYNPRLRRECERVARTCDSCQRHKNPGRGYGETPPQLAHVAPWHEVAVNLIGPWKVELTGHDEPLAFHALTSINTVTNLAEIIRISNKTSQHVSQQFENSWLARYPRPIHVIRDQG